MRVIYWALLVISASLFASCSKRETADMSGVLKFELNGENPMIVELGSEFNDPGVLVKYRGEDLSKEVSVVGDVNSKAVGYYELTYTFLNKDKLPTRTTRAVIVADPKVTADLNGEYIVTGDSKRSFNGTDTPFNGPVVKFERLAPGFYRVSDLFGGYYDQFLKRNTASQRMGGYVELKADNSLVLHSSLVPQWKDSLTEFKDASYDPVSKEIHYTATYLEGNMIFNVILKKA